MKKIIFATGNADKMKEIREILADLDAGNSVHERSRNPGGHCRGRQNLRGKML